MKTYTLLNTVHISFYLPKLEFPFIMTEQSESVYCSFFTKGSNFIFKAFNQFQIQLLYPRQKSNISGTKNGCDGNPMKGKSNSAFRTFVKSFYTFLRNFNIFPWVSNSCGKSRLRKIGKLLRALVILGIRSEMSRASTNKLEETTCVFFVTILFKT